jgi:hypothetical protein
MAAVTLKAKGPTYKTTQGDIWDIVALRTYGDEHGMHFIQDANFDRRFTDAFPASVILNIPLVISLAVNLKTRRATPNLAQLLPWLSPK